MHLVDYNAPLTENGAYTDKYNRAAEMIAVYDTLSDYLVKPDRPEHVAPIAYPEIQISETLTFDQILDKVVSIVISGLSKEATPDESR